MYPFRLPKAGVPAAAFKRNRERAGPKPNGLRAAANG